MVKIKPFAVEQWMDEYETTCKYNIAETCAASVSVNELRELSENKTAEIVDLSTILNYGDIRGSENLRSNLARLYSSRTGSILPKENILIHPELSHRTLLYFTL